MSSGKKRDREIRKLHKKLRSLKKKLKRSRSKSRSRSGRRGRNSSSSSHSSSDSSRSPRRSYSSESPARKHRSREPRRRHRGDSSGSNSRSRSPLQKHNFSRSRSQSSNKRVRRSRSTSNVKHDKRDKERSPRGAPRLQEKNPNLENGERSPRGASRTDDKSKDRSAADDGRKDQISSDNKATETNNTAEASAEEKDEDYIILLGDDELGEIIDGKPIDGKIAEKWIKILRLGLPKEVKANLIKKYPVPENCQTLKSPLLNAEIKSLLGIGRKKDAYQTVVQNQLGIGIGILGKVLTDMMAMEKSDKICRLFEEISDASRLFTDIHHGISSTRRFFIMPALDLVGKNIAQESPIDTYLFGEKFSEKLKAAKDVAKSAQEIAKTNSFKEQKKDSVFSSSNRTNRPISKPQGHSYLNWRGPPKKSYTSSRTSQGGPKTTYSRSSKKSTSRK